MEACVAGPGERVRLDFHASGEPMEAEVLPDGWHPEADVAFLRLPELLPEGVAPAVLAPSVGREGARVRALGCPEVGEIKGLWGDGRLVGRVTEAGRELLQLRSTQITVGFSGGPVWDEATSRVIGMVTQIATPDRYARLGDVAFAIPSETLCDLCPEKITLHYKLPPGTPFQAPAVPRYFVPRPEMSQALTDYLTPDAPPGALVVSAVHGLGGIGKTTLVAALAHDPAVQARFPDGVLWVRLGQEPDVLSFLSGWIQALGDYDFRPTVVDMASSHLCTLVHDKACLLVVDDAWQADHVRPFLVGRERCRVLVTTRDATLARKVGAQLYDLDVMTEAQALALFEARLGALDGDRGPAAALARELGYLPLALELAAAQIEAGVPWDELLAAFRQGLVDLAALDLDEAAFRNESLRLSFRLSLERLSQEDFDAFVWLGVLPEDVRLNPTMAATLWDEAEREACKRLRHLRNRALLKEIGKDLYTLHDLLHDEAKLRLTEQMSLPQAHAWLLDRYRRTVTYGRWDRLADDGYIHARLTWHLEQAGQIEAIHALLCLETGEERNAWYEAREALGQTAGYLEDIARAWRLADEELESHSSSLAVGFQCRYALITASVTSIARNIEPKLLSALSYEGVWTRAQALTYALHMPDPRQRAEALIGLVPHLAESQRVQATREVLTAARMIEDLTERAWTFVELAPYLRAPLLSDALAAVQDVFEQSHHFRALALSGLVAYFSGMEQDQVRREALMAAVAIREEDYQARALSRLAPFLSESLLQEALAAARNLSERCFLSYPLAEALTALAPHLPEPERAQVLQEALITARAIEDAGKRARILSELAPHLPKSEQVQLLRESLAAMEMMTEGSGGSRARVLLALAPHLPEPLIRDSLLVAQEIESEYYRAHALSGLAHNLPEPQRSQLLHKALATARAVEADTDRVRALTNLIPHLPEPRRTQVLREAQTTARAIEYDRPRAKALFELGPHLPETERKQVLWEALAAARTIRDSAYQALTLSELIPHLPEQNRAARELLVATRALRKEEDRANVLSRLIPHLPEPEQIQALHEALTTAQRIGDEWRRAEVLSDLAPHLSDSESEQVQRKTLAAAREIEDGEVRARVLIDFALHRSGDLAYEALESARAVRNGTAQALMLSELVPHLSEMEQEQVLREALTAVLSDYSSSDWAQVLAKLTLHLPESLLRETLAEVRNLPVRCFFGRHPQAEAMAVLAPCLPEPERGRALRDALAAAQGIENEWCRAQALLGLAPHLPKSARKRALQEALSAVRAIGEGWHRAHELRAKALSQLASYVPESESEQVLAEALEEVRAISEWFSRAEVLSVLSPHLSTLPRPALVRLWLSAQDGVSLLRFLSHTSRKGLLAGLRALVSVIAALGGEGVIAETYRAIQDVGRWWP
jgi:hypothetical protein